MLSVTEFKFITEGTKTIELHFTYQGVERVWSVTRYVSPADALRNASELLLEAWEMFLKEGGYLNEIGAPYTLKAENEQVASNSGVRCTRVRLITTARQFKKCIRLVVPVRRAAQFLEQTASAGSFSTIPDF